MPSKYKQSLDKAVENTEAVQNAAKAAGAQAQAERENNVDMSSSPNGENTVQSTDEATAPADAS